jgi:hypothetical protein
LQSLHLSDRKFDAFVYTPFVAANRLAGYPQRIDRKRIIRKIGELEPEYLAQVDAQIWRMFKPAEE